MMNEDAYSIFVLIFKFVIRKVPEKAVKQVNVVSALHSHDLKIYT